MCKQKISGFQLQKALKDVSLNSTEVELQLKIYASKDSISLWKANGKPTFKGIAMSLYEDTVEMLYNAVLLQSVVYSVPSFNVVFLIEHLKFFINILAALTIFKCVFSLIFSASFELLESNS